MKFYRYDLYGFGNLTYIVYNLVKETDKGYWIRCGNFYGDMSLKKSCIWISKTSKKRYAYPTKKEALYNFYKRRERMLKILESKIQECKYQFNLAKAHLDALENANG